MKAGEGNSFYPLQLFRHSWNGLYNNYDGLTAGLPPLGVNTMMNPTVVCTLEQGRYSERLGVSAQLVSGQSDQPGCERSDRSGQGQPIAMAQA